MMPGQHPRVGSRQSFSPNTDDYLMNDYQQQPPNNPAYANFNSYNNGPPGYEPPHLNVVNGQIEGLPRQIGG